MAVVHHLRHGTAAGKWTGFCLVQGVFTECGLPIYDTWTQHLSGRQWWWHKQSAGSQGTRICFHDVVAAHRSCQKFPRAAILSYLVKYLKICGWKQSNGNFSICREKQQAHTVGSRRFKWLVLNGSKSIFLPCILIFCSINVVSQNFIRMLLWIIHDHHCSYHFGKETERSILLRCVRVFMH